MSRTWRIQAGAILAGLLFTVAVRAYADELPKVVTADGLTLAYRISLPAPSSPDAPAEPGPYPVALLVHDYGGSMQDWLKGNPLPEDLHKAGFAVVAFDLRGHGESTKAPKPVSYMYIAKDGWQVLGKDFGTLLKSLSTVKTLDFSRVVVVAAGWGSLQVVGYYPKDVKPSALLLATPKADTFVGDGELLAKSAARWAKTPVWVLACKDAPGNDAALSFASKLNKENTHVEDRDCKQPLYGAQLFGEDPQWTADLVKDLAGSLPAKAAPAEGQPAPTG